MQRLYELFAVLCAVICECGLTAVFGARTEQGLAGKLTEAENAAQTELGCCLTDGTVKCERKLAKLVHIG